MNGFKMCSSFFKSKNYFYIRFCLLWIMVFLTGYFYVVSLKKTQRTHNLDYKKVEHYQRVEYSIGDRTILFNQSDETISEVLTFYKKGDNDMISPKNNDKSMLSKESNYDMQSKDWSFSFNNSEAPKVDPSGIPIYDNNLGSGKRHHISLVDINRHVPTYDDIITQYMLSKPDANTNNKTGYETLPAHYRLWNVHWTIRHSGMFPTSLYSPPPGEFPKQRLPMAILIGAGKCGTRALIEFLGMNPYVVTARSEIHFFDYEANFVKGPDWYHSKMPLSFSNQLTVEKSPSCLWSDRAPDEIYRMDKDMKLLVILKDPVERVISQAIRSTYTNYTDLFLDRSRNGLYHLRKGSNTVTWGVYVKYIKIWIKTFSAQQVHIVEAKELATDPAKEMKKIESFLGVPSRITQSNFYYNQSKGFHCMRPLHLNQQIRCLSKGKGRAHPKLELWLEKLLYHFYLPFNEELFSLLGRRFDWTPSRSREGSRGNSKWEKSNVTI